MIEVETGINWRNHMRCQALLSEVNNLLSAAQHQALHSMHFRCGVWH